MNKHMIAILAGVVTKTNVIGIRKSMNAADRRAMGCGHSMTAPKLTSEECRDIVKELHTREPRVEGALVASGIARLRNKRYKKRLASVAPIIERLTHFCLTGFDVDNTPIYKACSPVGSFKFKNVPWQRGGDGPELI